MRSQTVLGDALRSKQIAIEMRRRLIPSALRLPALLAVCTLSSRVAFPEHRTSALRPAICTFAPEDSGWAARALEGWIRENRLWMHLPTHGLPLLVLFDERCSHTLRSEKDLQKTRFEAAGWGFAVASLEHGDSLALPDRSRIPAQLTSFTRSAPGEGVFFVMALPAVWRASARDPRGDTLATVVFMHEFTHTQGGEIAGRIDSLMRAGLPADADDDVIQTRFENRPGFRAAYERERDLLFRAATASSLAEARRLAIQAVEEMDRRRGTFFTGGDSVYAPTEDVFLTLEGMGQWAAYLWLTDSLGGGMGVGDALAFVRRGREHWSQDEGLAIALVLSRFQPGWAPRTVRGTDGMLALLHQGLGMPRRGATKRRD